MNGEEKHCELVWNAVVQGGHVPKYYVQTCLGPPDPGLLKDRVPGELCLRITDNSNYKKCLYQ